MSENATSSRRLLTAEEVEMSERIFAGVMTRAAKDPVYEAQLRADTRGTIEAYAATVSVDELTPEELEAVAGGTESGLYAVTKALCFGVGYAAHAVRDGAVAAYEWVTE